MKNKPSCTQANPLVLLALAVAIISLLFSFSYSSRGSVKGSASANNPYSAVIFTASPKVFVRNATTPEFFKFHAAYPYRNVTKIHLFQDRKEIFGFSTFADNRGELVISVASSIINKNLTFNQRSTTLTLNATLTLNGKESLIDKSTTVLIK